MIKEVTLPEISENVDSGDVIEILVKVGDMVETEQSLAVLETEKATFEVPSPSAGKITEISIKEGDTVSVGQVIAKIDTEGKPDEKPTESEPQEQEEEQTSDKQPEAESTQEKAPEDAKKGESKKPAKKEEKQKKEPEKKPSRSETKEPEDVSGGEKSSPQKKTPGIVPAAPSVRQLARELGIDLSQVTGSESGGRVTADDVKQYARQAIAGAPAQSGGGGGPAVSKPLPDFTKWGEVERQRTSVTRRKIAETLSFTWANVPQVTQYDQADITLLEEFRKQYGDRVKQAGGKLTMTSILLKAVTMALQEFPKFNTSYDPETQEIIYKKYYHVAIAVDTDRGLLVPVVRDVDTKSLLELSVELSELAEKARTGKVTPDDMVGGNFTISNLGGLGGTGFSPIIYWPQTAILGVARGAQQPVLIDGAFQPRMIVPLSLSYDHRIIDGAEGVRFLRHIVELLEKPFLLAMHD